MSAGEAYGRHRMDRSLDEIAAEMDSDQGKWDDQDVTALPFGKDYEEREYIGAPIRDTTSSSSSRRHAPYSIRGRDRSNRAKSSEREPTSLGNRIFVANLSYSTTWQNLKDYMRKAGPVVKCDVFRDASGNSRGIGLVVFEDVEGAENSLKKLSNTELDNRKIYLRKDMQHEERERSGLTSYRVKGKPPPNPSATVFIGNLDYGITWQKLKDVFKVAGRIVNADILTDRDGKSKGVGEVQFEDPSDTISAIALFHGQMLSDRPMTVRMDSRAPFQPDPLQLKLSSLGAGTSLGSPQYVVRSQRGDYSFDQRGNAQYSTLRDIHVPSDSHSRRNIVFSSSRHDYQDNRRSYDSSPHNSYSRGGGGGDVYPSSSSMGAGDYRGSTTYSRRGSDDHHRGDNHSSNSGSSGGGNRRLFVKNLNYSTTWQHLKDAFREAGSVQHVDIMENPDGRSKGFAIIWFDAAESARKAIDMFNDYEMDGRKLEVRYDRLG